MDTKDVYGESPAEVYRLAAEEWVALDGAARLLEETKSAVLAQRIKAQGDMAYNKAERDVKASLEWMEFLEKVVAAKTKANLARVRMEYTRMKFMERQGMEASKRAEMRL